MYTGNIALYTDNQKHRVFTGGDLQLSYASECIMFNTPGGGCGYVPLEPAGLVGTWNTDVGVGYAGYTAETNTAKRPMNFAPMLCYEYTSEVCYWIVSGGGYPTGCFYTVEFKDFCATVVDNCGYHFPLKLDRDNFLFFVGTASQTYNVGTMPPSNTGIILEDSECFYACEPHYLSLVKYEGWIVQTVELQCTFPDISTCYYCCTRHSGSFYINDNMWNS